MIPFCQQTRTCLSSLYHYLINNYLYFLLKSIYHSLITILNRHIYH